MRFPPLAVIGCFPSVPSPVLLLRDWETGLRAEVFHRHACFFGGLLNGDPVFPYHFGIRFKLAFGFAFRKTFSDALSAGFLFDFFVFELFRFLFVKPGKHDFRCLLFFKVFLQDVPVFADPKGFKYGFAGSAKHLRWAGGDSGP